MKETRFPQVGMYKGNVEICMKGIDYFCENGVARV